MPEGFEFYPAPAKLNLMLHITGRRADGYHLLQTVFQLLDFGDEIGFRLRDDGQIRRVSESTNVAEQDDLVIKAANGLQAVAGEAVRGVDIHVRKKLPMGGGVGGGSSDAATTLVVLNDLWKLGLSQDQLSEIGVALGADVPVFVQGQSAWAEGVGEKLQPLALPGKWYVVINPGCHVSTAEIFSDSDLTRSTPLTTIADFLAHGGRNDCESVVAKKYPEIAEAIDWLKDFSPAMLTGTGACVFARFDTEAEAGDVLRQMPEKYSGFIAKGVNKSPLLDKVTS